MKNIFCRGFISLVFTLVAATTSFAQQHSLKIGESLPESFWTTPLQVVNHPQKTITLNQDKGKLILLDFWATWCSACLLNFPKMETLQKQFGDQIKVLAVTEQNRATLDKFFATANGKRYKDVVSVVGDKMLHTMFLHTAVPFIVWIKDGKIINTTDGGQVNEQTITEILRNEKSSLQTVIQIDRKRPLMLSENFDLEKKTQLLNYTVLTKGKIRAIPAGTGFHRKDQIVYGRQMTNMSLLNIYKAIAYPLFEQTGDQFSSKRIVNRLKNPTDIDFIPVQEKDEYKLYSIDCVIPAQRAESLYAEMLIHLNQNTEYTAKITKIPVKCLVLKRTSDKYKIRTKGKNSLDNFFSKPSILQNVPLSYLIRDLNADSQLTSLPVIDETGYKENVDLYLGNIMDFTSLSDALRHYELELSEETRVLNMLLISDK